MGANNLTTGNANNREISGVISNGGVSGGLDGSFTKVGTGKLTLSNSDSFTGLTTVNNGEIALNGSVSGSAQINANGRLSGTGTVVGNLNNNGVVAPGSQLSPLANLSILGNYTDSAGSVFETRVSGAQVLPGNLGAASRLTVFGNANLGGGTVRVLDNGGLYGMQTRYRILTNNGVQTGTFKAVVDEANLPNYLDASLIHSPQLVDLVLTRNKTDFADTSALTPNQRATALSLDAGVGAVNPNLFPTYDALLFAPDDATRRQSLNTISGDALTTYPFLANQAANRFNERIRAQMSSRAISDAAASFAKVDEPMKTVASNNSATSSTRTSTQSSAQMSSSFAESASRSAIWAVVGGSRDDADKRWQRPGFRFAQPRLSAGF